MYTESQLQRAEELFRLIESRKEHDFSAPTYLDSPALQEMADIMHSCTAVTAEVLEEKIPMLWYLTDCYDRMCRFGMSVKFYPLLLTAHAQLAGLRPYGGKEQEALETAFYDAVKARNQYLPDECADLAAIVQDCIPAEKAEQLRQDAIRSRRGHIKNDPVELTDAYLAVIDRVEARIPQKRYMGYCHEYWSLKTQYLRELGVEWRSPAVLNPRVMFD